MKRINIISLTFLLSMAMVLSSIIPVANAVPNYWVSGSLNTVSVNVTSSWKKIDNYLTFSKELGTSSVIEVVLASRATGGTFSGTNGVEFEVTIDDTAATIANLGAITTTNTIDFITINAIFTNLPAGSHTVSVWARAAPSGSSTGVVLDPGGWGGKIIVKEVSSSPTSPPSVLSVVLITPVNGMITVFPPASITLSASVTSGGNPVPGATVSFYVDGNLIGSTTSDINGSASNIWSSPPLGIHNWYVTASKSGYTSVTSSTWAFTIA